MYPARGTGGVALRRRIEQSSNWCRNQRRREVPRGVVRRCPTVSAGRRQGQASYCSLLQRESVSLSDPAATRNVAMQPYSGAAEGVRAKLRCPACRGRRGPPGRLAPDSGTFSSQRRRWRPAAGGNNGGCHRGHYGRKRREEVRPGRRLTASAGRRIQQRATGIWRDGVGAAGVAIGTGNRTVDRSTGACCRCRAGSGARAR